MLAAPIIALLNGQLIDVNAPALHVNDRGWLYGDGVFETMLLCNGRVRFVEDHLQRLQLGCMRLGMTPLPEALLLQELQTVCGAQQDGIVKLIVSRGRAERGYRPPLRASATRLWQLSPFTVHNESTATGIRLRWCTTRLSRNAMLAGIKHCNRLEQVIAQAEWNDPDVAEGLMLDTEGELVCGTMSNVFMVIEGVLLTPDLRFSGVAGVMRKNVLRMAHSLGLATEVRAVRAEEINAAQEVFICNAVRGIQPIRQLDEQQWSTGPLTTALLTTLRAS